MSSRFVGCVVDNMPQHVHSRKLDARHEEGENNRQNERKLDGMCTESM